jgi:hypothetical protein
MKRASLIAIVLLLGALAATWYCDRAGVLTGFKGAFLRTCIGYLALLGLSHFFYLFLPRIGIGSDGRLP